MKEEFKSKYLFDYRFQLYFDNKFSLIMLPPNPYGYMYELYDLNKEKILGRFDSIIDVIDMIKELESLSTSQNSDLNGSLHSPQD